MWCEPGQGNRPPGTPATARCPAGPADIFSHHGTARCREPGAGKERPCIHGLPESLLGQHPP
nr:MAG TPA: hypothetical protein [Caudoviricetes sp.]